MLMQRKTSQFLASTAQAGLIAAAVLMAAAPAYADTTVSTGTTATYVTSSAGNVTIAGTGTLTGPTGPVVTVDSSSNVTINSGGTISAGTATTAASGDIGISIQAGKTSTITNAGTISVLENFTPTTNGNFLVGPISGVSGRYGIYGAAGGTITGGISNTGTIAVYGENSAGIQIDSAFSGNINTQGTINVVGDNSYGVKLGNVTGNVTIGGTVTVTGVKAQGYVQSGNVTGAVVIDGAIGNAASYAASSGSTIALDPSKFYSSTPIVEIDGNVTGGIIVNAPTSSTSTDSNRGTINAIGNNPALQIGGATDITIGAGTTDNGSYDLGLDGTVTATISDNNNPYNAYAVVIGGKGGNVTMSQGIEVYGTVTAATISASATAIQINAGSTVPTLLNTGTIKAANNTSGIGNGDLIGVQDLSNTLTSITNQGYITVTGTTNGRAAAIDLSTSTKNVTITQSYTSTNQTSETTDKAASGYNPDTAASYAGMTGNIYTGSGNDTLDIQSGYVNGNAFLGAGNNTVKLADTTKWTGNIDFGTGGTATMTMADNSRFYGTLSVNNEAGTLTLAGSSKFLGSVTGGSSLDVAVNGGTFGAGAATSSTIHNLTVASGGALQVFINGTTSTSSLLTANSATFASGAKLSLQVNQLLNISNQKYTVLTAGTLTGASGLSSASSLNLPVLFAGTITSDANNVYVTLSRASASSLGLTAAQTSAYTAIVNDAAANTNLQSTLLGIYDTPTLRGRFNELLPNYAGGAFDIVSRAARTAGRHIDDDSTLFSISNAGAWLEPIVFNGTRTYGATPGFKTSGGGISTGFEKVTAIGNVGFSLAWLTGSAKAGTFQNTKASEFNLGLFWRKASGPLYVWAQGNVGRESFKSTRTFNGTVTSTGTGGAVNTANFAYNAAGHWAGWSAGLTAGVSYKLPLGEHFSIKPKGVIEYDHLKENGYIESGDTPIALTIAGRTSSQTTATTTLTAAWASGPATHEGRPFAVELEAGRRTWVSGNLGTTTGTFETGDTFSIAGDHLPSAWVGGLSILQGGLDYTWKIGTDVERGTDKGVAYGVRASISIAL